MTLDHGRFHPRLSKQWRRDLDRRLRTHHAVHLTATPAEKAAYNRAKNYKRVGWFAGDGMFGFIVLSMAIIGLFIGGWVVWAVWAAFVTVIRV